MSRNIFDVFEQMNLALKESTTEITNKMVTVKNQQGTVIVKNTPEEVSPKKSNCFYDKKDMK